MVKVKVKNNNNNNNKNQKKVKVLPPTQLVMAILPVIISIFSIVSSRGPANAGQIKISSQLCKRFRPTLLSVARLQRLLVLLVPLRVFLL